MVRRLKEIRNFQFKGILVILGCFLMMAVILFAERAGIHYQEKKRQISYIDRDRIVTEKEVVSSLKKKLSCPDGQQPGGKHSGLDAVSADFYGYACRNGGSGSSETDTSGAGSV